MCTYVNTLYYIISGNLFRWAQKQIHPPTSPNCANTTHISFPHRSTRHITHSNPNCPQFPSTLHSQRRRLLLARSSRPALPSNRCGPAGVPLRLFHPMLLHMLKAAAPPCLTMAARHSCSTATALSVFYCQAYGGISRGSRFLGTVSSRSGTQW
jgi:hypothetical protein